jgi:hypothetical protein
VADLSAGAAPPDLLVGGSAAALSLPRRDVGGRHDLRRLTERYVAIALAIAKPAIPLAAKRSSATVCAVQDPAAKALAAVLPTADECDRESAHESVAVPFAPAA